jgi:hypothetical protein
MACRRWTDNHGQIHSFALERRIKLSKAPSTAGGSLGENMHVNENLILFVGNQKSSTLGNIPRWKMIIELGQRRQHRMSKRPGTFLRAGEKGIGEGLLPYICKPIFDSENTFIN